ncbi:MFS transporter [Pseudocolwellia agarivorans]|uniref:MFS transporter n=1 Tax=Pseudocolwellia agarivorans TaxID=1911682 RepID=UPI00098440C4|nr:MFS transporter [Pseudocolwellia agarivorans]
MKSALFLRSSFSYFWYFGLLGLIIPFLPLFLDGKNFSSVEIGEILAIFTATKIIGPTLWAVLADKTGQQLGIIRLGAFLACAFFTFLFWLNDYWPVVFCLATFSLFWTAILPQLEVMTLNSIRRSAQIYARIRLWGSIGFIFFAVVAGEVIEQFSSEAFTYIGFIILFGLFLSTLLIKQSKIKQSQITKTSSIKGKLFNINFAVFFIAGLLLQLSFGPYYSFFALYLRDLQYPGFAVGILISLGVIAEITIFIYAGKIFKHFSVKNILVFSLITTSFRWFLMGHLGDSMLVMILSQAIHAASFGLYHSASIQFLQRHFDPSQQNRGQAVYIGGVYGIGGAIGAYLAGVLWLNGAGSTTAFDMAMLAAFIGAVFALFIKVNDRDKIT